MYTHCHTTPIQNNSIIRMFKICKSLMRYLIAKMQCLSFLGMGTQVYILYEFFFISLLKICNTLWFFLTLTIKRFYLVFIFLN